MEGDERVRYCGTCKLNVYNLSELSAREAEQLILKKEGNLCVRFFRRKDGTVITQDCPVGVRWIRSKAKAAKVLAASVLAWFLAILRMEAEEWVLEKVESPNTDYSDAICAPMIVIKNDAKKLAGCGPCESVNLKGQDGIKLFATKSTDFRQSEKGIEIKQGKVVLMTFDKPQDVFVKNWSIAVSKDSCVIIELGPEDDCIRMCNLHGHATTLSRQKKNEKRETLVLCSGDEICFKPRSFKEDELIPDDGIDREPIVGGPLFFPGLMAAKNTIDQEMMLNKEPLLNCDTASKDRKFIDAWRKRRSKETRPLRAKHQEQKQLDHF
jgi:hypothetical protein